MTVPEFLAYLGRRSATRARAFELANVLGVRAAVIPVTVSTDREAVSP